MLFYKEQRNNKHDVTVQDAIKYTIIQKTMFDTKTVNNDCCACYNTDLELLLHNLKITT